MAEIKVCSFPADLQLDFFEQRLQAMAISYRIARLDERQELYVNDQHLSSVTALIDELRDRSAEQKYQSSLVERILPAISRAPITYATVAIAIAVYLASMVPSMGFNLYLFLSFTEIKLANDMATQLTWQQTYLQDHQWWRLLGPVFLHFGISHILFNTLAMLEFGRRIEYFVAKHWVILSFCCIGIGSNIAQYMASPVPFGGLSGIAYGLFGLVFTLSYRCQDPILKMPKGFVIMMLFMLMLGPLGVIEALFDVQLANTAHFAGLILGALIGLIVPFRWQIKQD